MWEVQAIRNSSATFLGLLLLSGFIAPAAWSQELDVYVVYSGRDRADKNELMRALPEELSVKAYNADLLAIADYSGKQKTIAKLETASVVVILNVAPMEHLEGILASTDVLIVNAVEARVRSERRTIHVLARGTLEGTVAPNLSTINATAEGDLANAAAVSAADVIVVSEARLDMDRAVSLIIQRLLGT